MNDLQIFKNSEFGEVRTVVINNEPHFVGKDVAEILGYDSPSAAVSKKVDKEDRGLSKMETPSGVQEMTIINESGLFSLVLSSKLPAAKRFKHWVTSKVLPALRKTGSYTVKAAAPDDKAKRADAMLINARTRNAKLIAELAEKAGLPLYKNTLIAKAANIAAGEPLLDLPKVDSRPNHILGHFCVMLGHKESWASALGKKLKDAGIEKIEGETGTWKVDKSKSSNRQCDTFNWYDDYLIPELEKMFPAEMREG